MKYSQYSFKNINSKIFSSSIFKDQNLKLGINPPLLWNDFNLINENENKQFSSGFSIKKGNFFFNMNKIILNEDDSFKDSLDIKKENNNNNNNENNINNFFKDISKDINNNDNKNITSKKFFTDFNYGMKCSCNKVQCNKYYCECFRAGRYCINCNCKNCTNKPPKNSTNDIHILPNQNYNNSLITCSIKDKKVFCTCTKSECKFKYCECFKIGKECTDLCRCINCKNIKNPDINNNKFKLNITCSVNSISIINNEIYDGEKELNKNKKFLNKKRRKIDNKINDNKKDKNKKRNKDDDDLNGDLFDKNGNMIFKHNILSEFKKFQNL